LASLPYDRHGAWLKRGFEVLRRGIRFSSESF
jgi:hypothetical protein